MFRMDFSKQSSSSRIGGAHDDDDDEDDEDNNDDDNEEDEEDAAAEPDTSLYSTVKRDGSSRPAQQALSLAPSIRQLKMDADVARTSPARASPARSSHARASPPGSDAGRRG